jgi:DNA ligase-1
MVAAGPVEGLKKVGISVFRPIKPMLAKTAESVAEAWEAMKGPVALEYKLDGARVQIHARNGAVRIFSRNLADITEGFPEIVEQVRPALKKGEAIIEGEVIAVEPGGRPLPFQALSRRLGRVRDIETLRREIPVRLFLFDILFRDGILFIDKPNAERWRALAGMSLSAVPRIVPKGEKEGEAFFQKAVREGYEGVVAKALSGLYSPGTRGSAWFKVKKVRSLDLVITAAEWGYGRRHGWLSNYVLSARDEETGEYLPVGKTFKGLTDLEFQAMTERLLHLRTGESRWSVSVKPEVVVEVLFSDVQKSPRYESGYALRFARIARVRDDKPPAEIDSIGTIAAIFKSQ